MIRIGKDLRRINPEYFSKSVSNIIEIIETRTDGKAKLDLVFPQSPSSDYYKLEKEHDAWLKFSTNQQCADGIIISVDDNSDVKIYIVELKNSVRSNKWDDILGQFRGSLLRAIAFCSSIGLNDILEVRFYTGCENYNKIEEEKRVRTLQKQIPVGPIARKKRIGVNLANIDQWGEAEIKPFPDGQLFSHEIIQLTKSNGVNLGRFII